MRAVATVGTKMLVWIPSSRLPDLRHRSEANAELIVAMRNALPAILAQARLAAELDVETARLRNRVNDFEFVCRENHRLEGEIGELRARITTICDEACGLQPVQPAEESMTLIEQELASRARERERLERENGELTEELRTTLLQDAESCQRVKELLAENRELRAKLEQPCVHELARRFAEGEPPFGKEPGR